MKILKPLATTLALFAIVTFGFGQNYFDGYVVRNGTQTNGAIQYKTLKKDFTQHYIMFRESGQSSATKLTANEVERFHLDATNSTFIAVVDNTTGKKVFTEVIQEGPVTLSFVRKLYVLTKETGESLSFYIPITGKNIYSDKEEVVDKKLAEMKSIGLIKNFLEDCEKVAFKEYNISNINRAVSNYNACKGKPTTPGKTKIQTGVIAGYVQSNVDAIGGAFLASPGFKIGGSFDLQPRSYQVRTLLSMQLVYAQEGMRDQMDFYDNTLSTLRLPVMLKNYFRPGQTGVYIFPGISFYTPIKVTERKSDFLEYKNLGVTYLAGLGYEMILRSGKRVAASIRYERDITTFLKAADAFGSEYDLGAYQHSLQFDLTYKFGK